MSDVNHKERSGFPWNLGVSMDPMADMDSKRAARISARFLPKRSVIIPEMIHPRMVPRRAEDTTHPSIPALRLKCDCRKLLQPEIMAVSYPKRKPPREAVKLNDIK
jgi:hypothetical protein